MLAIIANRKDPDQTAYSIWAVCLGIFGRQQVFEIYSITIFFNQTLRLSGMEYSYSYLYSYLLEYFFSVLCCTLYLAKFMSSCTRTYLSTVTKKLYS